MKIKSFTALLAWVFISLSCLAQNRPNILVIVSDDMHWHHPGFNGGPVSTPNLDRLAEQGTSLSQFYVHSVCSPTRAAFLTGRYPFRNGMEERSHGNDIAGMLTDERTMAEALSEEGYYTGIIGKWHLGNWYKHHLPMQRGFDYQYGLYGALISYYDKTRAQFYDWHRNEETLRQDGYSTDLIADEFVKLMESYEKDKPFFMYVPFNAVHSPLEAPAELVRKYEEMIRDFSGKETGYDLKNGDALKFAMLESMDIAVGRMLDALEEKGFLENTLALYFNDNGGPRYNPPYRGGKRQNYEGGVRVPCILSWPGHIPAGKIVDEMIHVTDLYPTILNLAGASLKQKHPLDGMNMWKTIVKGKKSSRKELVHSLPGNDFSDMGTISIRQGPYKLVGEELYNIEKDPSETVDIANEYPKVMETLCRRIDELVAERRTPEIHTKITDTIRQPLLVFGQEENANPPEWLAPYLKELSEEENKTMGAEPFFEEVMVWDFKEGGYDTHHVYGFAVTKKGTVLAFSEGREKSKDDAGPKDQILKRSTDGGRTWGKNIYIERMDSTYWNANGHPGERETWTNCAPVVDKVTGNIFYFYALNDPDKEAGQRVTRVFYKKSIDDGLTWSDRVDITDILNVKKDGTSNKDENGNWILNSLGFPCDYLGRAMHMPGPGHGIQASDGRLILQFWNRTPLKEIVNGKVKVVDREARLYGVTVIYSDDRGETWKFGGFVDNGKAGMNESRLVELENGTFYVNARWAMGGLAYRVVSTSLDSTLDKWSAPKQETHMPRSTTVDAGMIRLTRSSKYENSRILYAKSNDFIERPGAHAHTYRNSMTVFMSYDEAKTWPLRKLIDPGWANYCDLAVLEDKTILLLWARGTSFEQQKVVCTRFNVEWLTDGKDSLILKPVRVETAK